MEDAKDWVFIAVVLVIFGYIRPMFYITLLPSFTIHWIDSLLFTFLITPSIGSVSFVWLLLPLPLILAIIGWAGFSYRPRLAFLRIGFYPTSLLVILLLILLVYIATFRIILIPINGIAFTCAALAAHQARKKLPK